MEAGDPVARPYKFSKYDACDCCPAALIYEQIKPVLSSAQGVRVDTALREGELNLAEFVVFR